MKVGEVGWVLGFFGLEPGFDQHFDPGEIFGKGYHFQVTVFGE